MRGEAVVRRRRQDALNRLEDSKFFEKGSRTEDSWQKRKDVEIENLQSKLGLLNKRK